MRAVALVVIVALAGCMGGGDGGGASDTHPTADPTGGGTPTATPQATPAPDPTPEPVPEPTRPGRISIEASSCDAVVWLELAEFAVVERILPPGFQPADAASLLGAPDTAGTGYGAAGPVTAWCRVSEDLGGPVGFVLPGTLIVPPELESVADQAATNGYEKWVGTDNPTALALLLERGWDARLVDDIFSQAQLYEEAAIPGGGEEAGLAIGQAVFGASGSEMARGYAFGTAPFDPSPDTGKGPQIRFWYQGPDGATYLEVTVSKGGLAGAAYCTYFDPELVDWLGPDCGDVGATGIILAGFEVTLDIVPLWGEFA